MRNKLISQFMDLNVGQLDEIEELTDDQLQDLIWELQEMQENGELNLETDQGVENLKRIVDSYLPKTLDNTWKNTTISWGTMVSEDIVDKILTFAIEIDDEKLQELCDEFFEEEDEEIQDYILNEDIWDYMNEIAPEGCYFGGSEGDGCDYGFWEAWG